MTNPFRTEQLIFKNQFVLITEDNEFRMSHWVKGFGIAFADQKKMLLEFNSSYDLQSFKENENLFLLQFRVYPNEGKQYDVVIDPIKEEYTYLNQVIPLKEFHSNFKRISNEN